MPLIVISSIQKMHTMPVNPSGRGRAPRATPPLRQNQPRRDQPSAPSDSRQEPAQHSGTGQGFSSARDRQSRHAVRFAPLAASALVGVMAAGALAQNLTPLTSKLGQSKGTPEQPNPLHANLAATSSPAPNVQNRAGLKLFKRWPLYGPQGTPQAADIAQHKNFENCWLLVTLGSLAKQCPHLIDQAIRIHPDTGQVQVRLYGVNGPNHIKDVLADMDKTLDTTQATWIDVDKKDILENRKHGGGPVRLQGKHDGKPDPIWPALFEAALAKTMIPQRNWLQRAVHGGPAGLDEGYAQSTKPSSRHLATQLITGQKPVIFDFQTMGQVLGATPTQRIDAVYAYLENALKEGCDISAAVMDETSVNYTPEKIELGMHPGRKDGLFGDHGYMIEGVHVNKQGEKCVMLRDPRGHNVNFEEETFKTGDMITLFRMGDGSHKPGKFSPGPFSVPLKQLYEAGTMSLQQNGGAGGYFAWTEREQR